MVSAMGNFYLLPKILERESYIVSKKIYTFANVNHPTMPM